MSISYFFDETVIIRRAKNIAGTDRSRFQATATAEANIQQLDAETAHKIEGVFGESYVLFCDSGVDIKEGDKVQCGDNKYMVNEVINAKIFGIENFKQVYITKLDED